MITKLGNVEITKKNKTGKDDKSLMAWRALVLLIIPRNSVRKGNDSMTEFLLANPVILAIRNVFYCLHSDYKSIS